MATRPGGRPTDTKGKYVRISKAAYEKIMANKKDGASFIRTLDHMLAIKTTAEGLKICTRCAIPKPPDMFFRHNITKDGLSYICKACDVRRSAEYCKETGYTRTEAFRQKAREKGRTTYDRRRQALLSYYQRNKNHINARRAVSKALKEGILTKQPCTECGDSKVHAHHHAGYAREDWLTVTWLCQEHHRLAHLPTN